MKTLVVLWAMLSKRPSKRDGRYAPYFKQPWDEVDNLIITRKLRHARPAMCEAFPPDVYCWYESMLGALPNIQPSSDSLFLMPSFAVETGKHGHQGAGHLCAYYGALMVDGAMQAYEHAAGHLTGFFGRTKAITLVCADGYLAVYAHHVEPSTPPQCKTVYDPPDRPDLFYHQNLVHDQLIGNYDAFKTAYKVIRNAQDIGYDLANDLLQQLIDYQNRSSDATSPQPL